MDRFINLYVKSSQKYVYTVKSGVSSRVHSQDTFYTIENWPTSIYLYFIKNSIILEEISSSISISMNERFFNYVHKMVRQTGFDGMVS